MKRILLLATALSAMALAHAAGDQSVTVNLLSGPSHAEAIATVARIEMTDGNLSLIAKADGAVLYTKPISECKSIYFGVAAPDALPQVIAAEAQAVTITPEPAARAVRISGLQDGQPVRVYSLTGALELSGAAPVVSLSGLPKGVHIVVAGPAAAKVTVK